MFPNSSNTADSFGQQRQHHLFTNNINNVSTTKKSNQPNNLNSFHANKPPPPQVSTTSMQSHPPQRQHHAPMDFTTLPNQNQLHNNSFATNINHTIQKQRNAPMHAHLPLASHTGHLGSIPVVNHINHMTDFNNINNMGSVSTAIQPAAPTATTAIHHMNPMGNLNHLNHLSHLSHLNNLNNLNADTGITPDFNSTIILNNLDPNPMNGNLLTRQHHQPHTHQHMAINANLRNTTGTALFPPSAHAAPPSISPFLPPGDHGMGIGFPPTPHIHSHARAHAHTVPLGMPGRANAGEGREAGNAAFPGLYSARGSAFASAASASVPVVNKQALLDSLLLEDRTEQTGRKDSNKGKGGRKDKMEQRGGQERAEGGAEDEGEGKGGGGGGGEDGMFDPQALLTENQHLLARILELQEVVNPQAEQDKGKGKGGSDREGSSLAGSGDGGDGDGEAWSREKKLRRFHSKLLHNLAVLASV